MITIGTVKFDFKAGNEPFVQDLYKRWDRFFEVNFEKVASDVLQPYDQENEMITIESLPIDLGMVQEEDFDRQFAERLRCALTDYLRGCLDGRNDSEDVGVGVRRITVGKSALEILSFYLLHGCFPYQTEAKYTNPSFLLEWVIATESYRFREFLEAYGHYDFLYQRLAFQFRDEELEKIVDVVRPSESKFVNLYARVQIGSYTSLKRTDIGKNDYRNTVWILILAYILSETQGHFDRKQLIIYTLGGIASHLNVSFENLLLMLTDELDKLEQKVEQLPEFWSILKELETEVKNSLRRRDGQAADGMIAELVSFLRFPRRYNEQKFFLKEQLIEMLVDIRLCRKLLSVLQEREIHRIIGIIIPQESGFVISYASALDRNKEMGAFAGKAGSEFRLLKWELILAVLVVMPASLFVRKQFVLSVLQRLAAHYNLDVIELIRFFSSVDEWGGTFLNQQIVAVLIALSSELVFDDGIKTVWTEWPEEDIKIVLRTPFLSRRLLEGKTDKQIGEWMKIVMPVQGEFVWAYACFLDESHTHGLLEGKAGGEFRVLKWEFIFACLLEENQRTFHYKNFVYSVLVQLAAHYNQKVVDLLCYFFREQAVIMERFPFVTLKEVLKELYEESMLPLAKLDVVRNMNVEDMQYWLLCLLGERQGNVSNKEEYLEKWLIYLLEERNEVFRRLWKAGRLDTVRILTLVNKSASLQHVWLRRIGDGRLLEIYKKWLTGFSTLRKLSPSFDFLAPVSEYLRFWMVELTARGYLEWSETEIEKFLLERISKSVPAGFMALIAKEYQDMNINNIIDKIRKLKKEGVIMETTRNEYEVNNAGLILCAPFYPRLFHLTDLIKDHSFKDENCQVKAVFMLQYLVYGVESEWEESELVFNKIIVGLEPDRPLPRKVELDDREKAVMDEMLTAVGKMWEILKNTSLRGIREAFMQRHGILKEKRPGCWELKLEERAYDILIDSIPWVFRFMKFPWGNTIIETKWRR